MSERTLCNYCTLRKIKQDAKEKGTKVTILDDAKWGMGGFNIYVHNRKLKISDIPGGEDGDRAQYRAAWMMSIPKHCEC